MGLEYWVSGPKKYGHDRNWAGGGPVYIDDDVADEYRHEIRGCESPDVAYLTWPWYAEGAPVLIDVTSRRA